MIKPFVDAMSVSPEGGHPLFDSSGNNVAEAASSSGPRTVPETPSAATVDQHTTPCSVPPSVTYSDDTVVLFAMPCKLWVTDGSP